MPHRSHARHHFWMGTEVFEAIHTFDIKQSLWQRGRHLTFLSFEKLYYDVTLLSNPCPQFNFLVLVF